MFSEQLLGEQKGNSEGDLQDFRTYLKGSVTNQCGTGIRLDSKDKQNRESRNRCQLHLHASYDEGGISIQLVYLINNARVTGCLGKKETGPLYHTIDKNRWIKDLTKKFMKLHA